MTEDPEIRSGITPTDVPADPPEDADDVEADAADDDEIGGEG